MSRSAVTYVDHMGSDVSVVNAARVSFARATTAVAHHYAEIPDRLVDGEAPSVRVPDLEARDVRLLHYLARGMSGAELDAIADGIIDHVLQERGDDRSEIRAVILEQLRRYRHRPLHWSPFAHAVLQVRVRAPFAIARQLETHQAGLAANEVSRRYVDGAPEVLKVEEWRRRPESRKQGSGSLVDRNARKTAAEVYRRVTDTALAGYDALLEVGVAPEQARFVLPTGTFTEWIWTGSLAAFARIATQRADDHAQQEVRDVAAPLIEILEMIWPESWRALKEN